MSSANWGEVPSSKDLASIVSKLETTAHPALLFPSKTKLLPSVYSNIKAFNIMVIQVYAPITVAKEAGVDWFYEGPQDLLELTAKKKKKKRKNSFLIIGNWNEKLGSQNTQNDGKVWPLSTKRSRTKADRVLSIENTGHIKHPFQATQGITLHIRLNGLP